ncbi:glyoxalase superfamily protein [Rhodopseudomonas telluris]|uniref:Glyoxalase superfamily protein n=1 Tax=Rhodopseudomonas telluris TaxID=644215 RepID=A0ABV6ET27_9BRAD
MRDFRDAKVMAQTLREALNARSYPITHSESLELVAKTLGFPDWNVLSAKIQSAAPSSRSGSEDPPKSVRREIEIDRRVLDQYVGFYRLGDQAVMTISREGDQLISRLTGQQNVPIYGETKTRFFAKVVDAQISFIANGDGNVSALVLHQNGRDIEMKRIDREAAEQLERGLEAKVDSQSPSDGTEQALRRLIDSLFVGEPNFDDMSAPLAEEVRKQWSELRSSLVRAGKMQSHRFIGVGSGGVDVYLVRHEHRSLYWRIGLDSGGTIVSAYFSPGL